MAVEIERKFLVVGPLPEAQETKALRQGYIAREAGRTVRVRQDGARYRLTVKGPSEGIGRLESEIDLQPEMGDEMLDKLCGPKIEKTRHIIEYEGFIWEVDVFHGANDGLMVAEIELPDAHTPFQRPPWLGPEVSLDPRFFNAALVDAPFSSWGVSYADLLKQMEDAA